MDEGNDVASSDATTNEVLMRHGSRLSPTTRRGRGLALVLATGAVLAGCAGSHGKPAASPSPSASPTASPTPPPVVATYPLTGLRVTDPARARRPALTIKVDNVQGAFPQRGLNSADIVFDALVEGGLTRLTVMFQSQDVSAVGPIRSARPVDADLVRLVNGGLFAYSGAAPGEIAPMIAHGHAVRIAWDYTPQYFFVLGSYPRPHDVFASTATLYRRGAQLAPRLGPAPSVFTYSAAPLAGPLVAGVTVPFSGVSTASWAWTGSGYARTQDGRRDVLADGHVIGATNVVIMSVAVAHTGIHDAAGNEDPLDVVIGSGACWVLRDGRMVAGTWRRPSVGSPMQLLDARGHVIGLRPGRTWVELQPRSFTPRFR